MQHPDARARPQAVHQARALSAPAGKATASYWPAAVREALGALAVHADRCTRRDGQIVLRVKGGRVCIARTLTGAVVLSAVIGELPPDRPARERRVQSALLAMAPSFGRFRPALCVSEDRLLVQCAVDTSSPGSFRETLARFVQELRRHRQASSGAAAGPATAVSAAAVQASAFGHERRHVYL